MTGTETNGNGFLPDGTPGEPASTGPAVLLRTWQRHPLSRRLADGRRALRWADRRRLGLGDAEVRSLLRRGYLTHFTSPCAPVGSIPLLFPAHSPHLHKGSWLVLTALGEGFLRTPTTESSGETPTVSVALEESGALIEG